MISWLLFEALVVQKEEAYGRLEILRRKIEVQLWYQAVPMRPLQHHLMAVVAHKGAWQAPSKMHLQKENRKLAAVVCCSSILMSM